MRDKDIVALVESITKRDVDTVVNYSVDIADWLKRNRPSTPFDENGELLLLISAIYKLGIADAFRIPNQDGDNDERPVFIFPFPT